MKKVKVGVIGLGFIGPAHIEALRRTGIVEVAAFADNNPEVAKKSADMLGVDTYYTDYKDLLKDKSIQSVHVCTPNFLHYPMVKEALNAGKHVLCEKPLATSVKEAKELVELAEKKGIANAVNFNLRFYPLMRHVRLMVKNGEIGGIYAIHGSYLQDWLYYDTDYNWRLEPSMSGESRAVADVGSHWMDLIEHISGVKIVEVFADFATIHKKRKKPSKPIETYSGKLLKPEDYEEMPINTEDYATVLFRFSNGARGALTVSQVSAGRKNRLYFELDGSKKAVAFDSEIPNQLWIGNRDKPNESLLKDPSLVHAEARAIISYPGGHNEGFPDTFKQLYKEFYGRILEGKTGGDVNYATFKSGLRELELCDRIIESSRSSAWIKI
ncbi:MAG: Gfo/Idh/MocA family oxidoreductase [Planctomycetes bacterium]|nr:Gfo/Idh/MocA family oxidoreductase [Planctomycetota bacterium]